MSDSSGGEGFLPETRDQHRVVTDQVWKNDFDCVSGFEKDMPSLIDDTHPAMSNPFVQLITTVEDRLSGNRLGSGIAIIGAMVDVIRIAAPTNWAFFHLLVRSKGRRIRDPQGCLRLDLSRYLRRQESRSTYRGDSSDAASLRQYRVRKSRWTAIEKLTLAALRDFSDSPSARQVIISGNSS